MFSVYSGFDLGRFSVYSGFGLNWFHCISSHVTFVVIVLVCLVMHYGKSENNNNQSFLTIHVLDNLKIAALCNADMTAMTACKLFSSNNFWKIKTMNIVNKNNNILESYM